MKKGMIVTIYQDPLTCHRQEGKAELIRRLRQDDEESETWEVRFSGERETYERKIRKDRLHGQI